MVEEVERSPGAGAVRTAVASALPLAEISLAETPRIETGLGEFDRTLGGGIVPGSLILVGGDPGIGKSTLLLQAVVALAQRKVRTLYVSGEESMEQVALRAERLGARSDLVWVLAETDLERVIVEAERIRPDVLVVDSVQTIYSSLLDSVPGSLGQVREVTGRLMALAKTRGVPVLLIGHVTKEGQLAGPKTLEHLVDVVLYFEGERSHAYRLLRATKNRFGSTNELGVFEMHAAGLVEVANPSAIFLAERPLGAPGSTVVAALEGSRPLLVEVQALVATSSGPPRRTALGVDANRVHLLLAVLERRVGIDAFGGDVFMNVAGGIKLTETASDLAVLIAIASAYRRRPIDAHTVCVGEVGLAGEIRSVGHMDVRLAEAAKLGFKRCVMPARSELASFKNKDFALIRVKSVEEALNKLDL